MLIKKIMLLFYSAMLPLCSLSQDTDTVFKLRIKGAKIPKTAKIYLLYQRDGKKIVDSAQSTNRTFIFTGMLKEPVHAFILCDTMQLGFSEILKRKNEKQDSQQLFIYPGQIVLKTSTSSIADLRPVGGLNATYFRLQDRLQTLTQQQIELSRILVQATDRTSIPALKTKWDSLKRVEKHILRVFIIENPNSFIALHALQSYAGALPQVSEIELLFNKISPSVRQTPTGKEFRKFLSDQHDLNPGTKAPEFVQNDTTGKPISLASFKGKYLLIDFWASWCGPCRQINPELVKLYDAFNERNFTILGISLDDAEGKDAWLKAIKDDGLKWTQVADLKHWENQVARLYSIRKLPYNFLIDPDGVIIARDLDMKALTEKLKQVLLEK